MICTSEDEAKAIAMLRQGLRGRLGYRDSLVYSRRVLNLKHFDFNTPGSNDDIRGTIIKVAIAIKLDLLKEVSLRLY